MKAKIYLSDEGFGHIVRQRAIIEELKKQKPDLFVHVQTHQHIDFAKKNMLADAFTDKFNLIQWHKKHENSPDLSRIEDYYEDYETISDAFIASETKAGLYDFYISDFVYEAFEIASSNNKPSFGVSHFTWDWFFAKLYPPPLSRKILRRFYHSAHKAKILFFPPFTPKEILTHYKKNAFEVPFIVRSQAIYRSWPIQSKGLKILIMDSGAGLMKSKIINAFRNKGLETDEFYFASPYQLEISNCYLIPTEHLLVDYVKEADLVIGRPGFNTISECMALKVPMLLISEAMNPEMEHNITELKKERLVGFLHINDFEFSLRQSLNRFFREEFHQIKNAVIQYESLPNGAKVISDEILNLIYG